MKQLFTAVLGIVSLGTLTGCSSSVAAPIQNVPNQTQVVSGLAPQNNTVSESLIKIPEGRKAAPLVKPVTVTFGKTERLKTGEVFSEEDSLEQNRKQYKQDKMERKYPSRQEGRSVDSKKDDRRNKDERRNSDNNQPLNKQVQESVKPITDNSKTATPATLVVENGKTEVSPTIEVSSALTNSPSSLTVSSSTSSVPVSSAVTSTSTTSATFTVTYGSAANSAERNFKKPTLPTGVPSWFADNDKDSDGQLTMNEWPSDRFEEFGKFDRNGDGIITLEEAMKTVPKVVASVPVATAPVATPPATASSATPTAAVIPPKAPATASISTPASAGTQMTDDEAKRSVDRFYSFIDANKDGFLDEKEIANTQSIKSVDWKKYDLNKDVKLDMSETIALYKAEGNTMRRGMGGGGGGFGNMSPEDRAKTMFDNMDKNKTGKISKEQFPGFWRDRFGEFDTNKDGFVDFEEYKTGFAKMMPNGVRGGQGGPGGGRNGFGGNGGDNNGRGGRGGENGGRGARGGFGGGNG